MRAKMTVKLPFHLPVSTRMGRSGRAPAARHTASLRRRPNQFAGRSFAVACAIFSSSLVGTTIVLTRDEAAARSNAPALFFSGSISTPSQRQPATTSARVAASFSPMPPVNTMPSSAAQRGGQRADLPDDAVDEQVDRLAGRRLRRGAQRAHVGRDAGDAEQARLPVEQVLDAAASSRVLLHQVEQHAGIERAAARAHHQPVDGGEAHRAGDAPPVANGAQAGAVAEMRDDQIVLARSVRRGLAQLR